MVLFGHSIEVSQCVNILNSSDIIIDLYSKDRQPMLAEVPKVDVIRLRNANYDLKVTYQEECGSVGQKLDLYLKIFDSATGSEVYKAALEDSNSESLISIFSRLEFVFECFREDSGFSIDLSCGKILIKGIFQMRGKKIQKKYTIELQKHKVNELERMFQQIQDLEQDMIELKRNKDEREALLRKQYEMKFSEEKKKFEEVIKRKESEVLKMQQKQKQLQQFIEDLNQKMSQMINKMNKFAEGNLKELLELKLKSEKCEKELEATREKLQEMKIIKEGTMGRKLGKAHERPTKTIEQSVAEKKKVEKQLENMQQQNKTQIYKSSKTVKPARTDTYRFVDERSPYINQFLIKDKFIYYNGEDKKETQLLMKSVIPRKQFHFQFYIVKSKNDSILIGVIDQSEALKNRYSDKRSTSYWAKTGYVWGANKLEGDGFKEGDTVHVTVELSKPFIEWKVNGKAAASFNPHFFQNQSRVFVPFIEMENVDDCVMWNEL